MAFAISAAALVEVAAWANVHTWLRWGFAVLVDAAALLLIGLALKSRSEGYLGRARFCWTGVAFLTLTSSVLNAAHAADGDAHGWRLWAGVGMAALPPILVWLSVHVLSWVHAATPDEQAARQAAAEKAAEEGRARQERAAEREARHAAKLARITAEAEAHAQIEAAERQAHLEGRVAAAQAKAHKAVHDTEVTAPTESPAPQPSAAAPAPAASSTPAGAPTAPAIDSADRDAEVLRLVARGLSDSAIAKRPGMPSRATVGRIRQRAEASQGETAPVGDAQIDLALVSA
ncbi:hypothetical protein [Actinotalea sp. C106]|uniref:hypothetical protein n=1 Tax=Actinotalea sp. C106 TaxID=2908644 RepID=UPI0020277CD8|nr:hypothetical protein [Actinotalea sp. C106]